MNVKRLGLAVAIAIWLPLSVFLAHLIPGTPWPVAVLVGPLFSLAASLFLFIAAEAVGALWRWLRTPEPAVAPPMTLERWHRLYEKGVDPDTHRCTNEWVKEGETMARWGCRPCMEVERELAE